MAVRILAQTPDAILQVAAAYPDQRRMRLFIAARTRFAEDTLAAAVARGARQLVVLGTGLDTFAYRNPYAEQGLRVFEVDHPTPQGWERARLAEVGIVPPETMRRSISTPRPWLTALRRPDLIRRPHASLPGPGLLPT